VRTRRERVHYNSLVSSGAADDRAPRCDVLDLLEAAIVLRREVELVLIDGTRGRERPRSITARNGEDIVTCASGREVGVSAIAWVVP